MHALTSFAFAVGLVGLSWLVIGIALIGVGGLTTRLWRGRSESALDHAALWVGFSVVIAALQIWNCFAPISVVPAIIFLCVGLPAGVVTVFKNRVSLVSWPIGSILVFALIALWLADRALAPANASDSGLYHLPAIRLANDFAIVPGVGNLMPAFAVGSGSFLFTAMLNFGPLAGRAWHVANSLLLIAFIARIWPAVIRVVKGAARGADGFDAAMIPPCLFLLLGKDVSSPKTDLPAGLLLIVMASQLARVLCDRESRRSLRAQVITAAVLGGAAVCVKISAAPLAGLLWLAFAWTWWRRECDSVSDIVRLIVPLVVIALPLPGLFIVRNVITSGYPFFPAAAFPIKVDWRLDPAAIADYHRGFAEFTRFDLAQGLAKKVANSPLRFYAKLMDPGFSRLEDATATNWIRGWFFTMLVAWPIEVALPIVIAAGLWFFGRRGDETSRRSRSIIAAAVALTLVAWFITVPDGRYIWFATWTLAGAAAIPVLAQNHRRGIVLGGFAAACLAVVAFRVGLQLVYRDGPIADVFIIRPGPDHGFHSPPALEMSTFTSRSGMKIDYPTIGAGTVFYAPQPATAKRYLNPDLKFRGKDFQSGVMIDRDHMEGVTP